MSSFGERGSGEAVSLFYQTQRTKIFEKGDNRILKAPHESFDDYLVRLYEHKEEYGLTCSEIADLLNRENGKGFGECTYRKFYSAFNKGRMYERNKLCGESKIATRILSISDLHVPFQLPIETFKEYRGIVDILVLNGDLIDNHTISKFPKTYRVSPMEEIIEGRQYIIDLIDYIRPQKVLATYGNHCIRFQAYMSKYLDPDIAALMPNTVLDLIFEDGFNHYDKRRHTKSWYEPIKNVFAEQNIEIVYTGNWFCQVGKTIFAHPQAYSSGMMKTAEKALTFFNNQRGETEDFDTIVLGHTHRLGDYTLGGVTIYEQGCCCDVAQNNYSNGHLTTPQTEGYIYVCQDSNGSIVREATKLVRIK